MSWFLASFLGLLLWLFMGATVYIFFFGGEKRLMLYSICVLGFFLLASGLLAPYYAPEVFGFVEIEVKRMRTVVSVIGAFLFAGSLITDKAFFRPNEKSNRE